MTQTAQTLVGRFFSNLRYFGHSAAKLFTAPLVWGALFYIMHPLTMQNGFPGGDFVFLTWSVLLGLLAQEIYLRDMCTISLDTLALEDPVHGGLALFWGVAAATTLGFGVVGCQNLIAGIHFLVWPPTNFPDYFVNNAGENWQKIGVGGLYICFAFAAAVVVVGAVKDIIHNISYHKDLVGRREEAHEN